MCNLRTKNYFQAKSPTRSHKSTSLTERNSYCAFHFIKCLEVEKLGIYIRHCHYHLSRKNDTLELTILNKVCISTRWDGNSATMPFELIDLANQIKNCQIKAIRCFIIYVNLFHALLFFNNAHWELNITKNTIRSNHSKNFWTEKFKEQLSIILCHLKNFNEALSISLLT